MVPIMFYGHRASLWHGAASSQPRSGISIISREVLG
jgi:hypothetical protein